MRHRALLTLTRVRLRLAGFRPHFRLLPRQRAVLFFPLAIALTVTSIVFAARSSNNMCTPFKSVAAAKATPSATPSQKLCRPPAIGQIPVGR